MFAVVSSAWDSRNARRSFSARTSSNRDAKRSFSVRRYTRRFGRLLVHASGFNLPSADCFQCVLCSQVMNATV